MEDKGYIYFQQNLGNGIIKYMRIIRDGENVEYDDCTFDGKKIIDFNEKITDASIINAILSDPRTTGLNPIVFHQKTGIPM